MPVFLGVYCTRLRRTRVPHVRFRMCMHFYNFSIMVIVSFIISKEGASF